MARWRGWELRGYPTCRLFGFGSREELYIDRGRLGIFRWWAFGPFELRRYEDAEIDQRPGVERVRR